MILSFKGINDSVTGDQRYSSLLIKSTNRRFRQRPVYTQQIGITRMFCFVFHLSAFSKYTGG